MFKVLIFLFSIGVHAAECPVSDAPNAKQEFLAQLFKSAENLSIRLAPNSSMLSIIQDCEINIEVWGLTKCTQRVKTLLEKMSRVNSSGHTMGWEISDKEYLEKIPAQMKQLPPELSNGLPDNWEQLAKQKGWKAFRYQSRLVANPPYGSYSRVLFLVEGQDYDQWIQFTIPDSASPNTPKERLIDIVAMDKKNSPKRPYFWQLWRDENGKNPQIRNEVDYQFDSCYSCHPNGMRELSPLPGSYNAGSISTLDYMNAKMRSYGKADFGNALHPEVYGPSMGKNQGCTKCHDNGTDSTRHPLNRRHDQGHVRFKVEGDYSMPETNLSYERDYLEFIKNIPQIFQNLPNGEEKRKELLDYLNRRGGLHTADVYPEVLSWLFQQGLITKAKYDELNAKFKGNVSSRDPHESLVLGLETGRRGLMDQIYEDYKGNFQSWALEFCPREETQAAEPTREVRDGNRTIPGSEENGSIAPATQGVQQQ